MPPSIPPWRFERVRDARARVALLREEQIVVLAAAQGRPAEADAVLDAQDGRQAEERLGQVGLELVEHRLAEACGDARGHDFAHAADRVLRLCARPRSSSTILAAATRIGAAHDVGRAVGQRLDLGQRDRSRDSGTSAIDVADLRSRSRSRRAPNAEREHLLRDHARRRRAPRSRGRSSGPPPR